MRGGICGDDPFEEINVNIESHRCCVDCINAIFIFEQSTRLISKAFVSKHVRVVTIVPLTINSQRETLNRTGLLSPHIRHIDCPGAGSFFAPELDTREIPQQVCRNATVLTAQAKGPLRVDSGPIHERRDSTTRGC